MRSAWITALVLSATLTSSRRSDGASRVTLIAIGDIHAHLVDRADVRTGHRVGGLARVASVIRGIRESHRGESTLLVNSGDAVQGSAEALFTRGGAVVAIMNRLGIAASAPGNWDYVYGAARFRELFAGSRDAAPVANWHALAANLYDDSGRAVLPAYRVVSADSLRIGIVGLTTSRGLPVMGPSATRGLVFTAGDSELTRAVAELRERERVQLVVVASELELANNVRLADEVRGIDVILSSDMHERTLHPIVTRNGTIIVENGQDGTMVGELTLDVGPRGVTDWCWVAHDVTDSVAPDLEIARAIDSVRAPFLDRGRARALRNPMNGAALAGALDSVVGFTSVPLARAAYADEEMPAVIEGSSHDLIADAMRDEAHADVAILRGFRFGTQLAPGPITLGDLYYWLPIGAQVARVRGVTGAQLQSVIERCLAGTFDPDPRNWTGGWVFAFSGITFAFDPYAPVGHRARDIRVGGAPLDSTATYSVAGFWFADAPRALNGCTTCVSASAELDVLRGARGEPLDVTDVVARWLARQPRMTATTVTGRIRPLRELPRWWYGNRVLQPVLP